MKYPWDPLASPLFLENSPALCLQLGSHQGHTARLADPISGLHRRFRDVQANLHQIICIYLTYWDLMNAGMKNHPEMTMGLRDTWSLLCRAGRHGHWQHPRPLPSRASRSRGTRGTTCQVHVCQQGFHPTHSHDRRCKFHYCDSSKPGCRPQGGLLPPATLPEPSTESQHVSREKLATPAAGAGGP